MIRYARVLHGLLFWAAVFVATPGWAADDASSCDDALLGTLGRHHDIANLRHPANENDAGPGVVVAEACRIWPYDDVTRLAVVAYSRSATNVVEGDRELGLVVAMLDTAATRVIASHTDTITEDAVMLITDSSLRLDTARYDLAPNVRAFGISIGSAARGPSCPDGGANDELRLFVRDGVRLRQVLSIFQDDWRQVSGSFCNRSEASIQESARVSVGVEKSSRRGFADLRLIAIVERTEMPALSPAELNGEGETTTTRRETRVIRYNGKRYQPDGYDALGFWSDDE
jgi:hypothetical protein